MQVGRLCNMTHVNAPPGLRQRFLRDESEGLGKRVTLPARDHVMAAIANPVQGRRRVNASTTSLRCVKSRT